LGSPGPDIRKSMGGSPKRERGLGARKKFVRERTSRGWGNEKRGKAENLEALRKNFLLQNGATPKKKLSLGNNILPEEKSQSAFTKKKNSPGKWQLPTAKRGMDRSESLKKKGYIPLHSLTREEKDPGREEKGKLGKPNWRKGQDCVRKFPSRKRRSPAGEGEENMQGS